MFTAIENMIKTVNQWDAPNSMGRLKQPWLAKNRYQQGMGG